MACGIYRVYNLKTDMNYLAATDDLSSVAAKERFLLDMGDHPNKALQEDYETTGLEVFVIAPVKETSTTPTSEDIEEMKASLAATGASFYPSN